MEIGNVLHDWRLLERMTLQQAADRVGLPLSTYRSIEEGNRVYDRTMVILLRFLFE
ncbi:MAG: hypothetical protein WA172_11160 [Terriglobales bacterium]|jgi:transcriptional regulator with XRE-family HTH domain